jgi:hypothetical protein
MIKDLEREREIEGSSIRPESSRQIVLLEGLDVPHGGADFDTLRALGISQWK